MANAMFASGKDDIMNGGLALLSVNLKVVLMDHGVDTPVPATDDFLSDISTGVISTTANLGTKTLTAGVFDAADTLFPSVTDLVSCESYVIYEDTTVASTSQLIAFFDTATGLPITGNGNDVDLLFDPGANKVFAWNG